MSSLLDDLRELIARREVVVLVGAGVSIGATSGNPLASWTGLLEHGVARCEEVAAGDLPARWGERVREEIHSSDLDELLSAAEKITNKLTDRGEFGRWLSETVGVLTTEAPEGIEALCALGLPLATTNYDGLLEAASGLSAVTWRDGAARIQPIMRGDEQAILHVHGYWRDPESVVLGVRSYDRVLGEAYAQALLRALTMTKSWLFVGFGAGLKDPNFSALRRWMGDVLAESPFRHYRLAHDGELEDVRAQHTGRERVQVISYGSTPADLGEFLRALVAAAEARKGVSEIAPLRPRAGVVTRLPAPPRCFGRDALLSRLVDALTADGTAPVPVLGPPGIGKSTLCLAALHRPEIAQRFGTRRYFVRCDGARTGEALVVEIATATGVEIGPELEPRLVSDLAREPAALVLDNAESPWEADPLGTERLLGHLAGIESLVLVASLRGAQRPPGPSWRESIEVTRLEPSEARKLFLAVAGERHAHDAELDDLLSDLDGVPLAIELLAYHAEAEPSLAGVRRRWKEERVAMLTRNEDTDPRLNVAASLEVSICGKRMNDEARSLLSILALLPDGIAHSDLGEVHTSGERAAATLRKVGLAFDEGDRLRVLKPVRDHVASQHPPRPEELTRAVDHYGTLARTYGPQVGQQGGAKATTRLQAETGNLEAALERGLASEDPTPSIRAAIALGSLLTFSGLGSPRLLELARQAARALNDTGLEASTTLSLGDIALERSDHDTARARYQEALLLYHQVGDLLGQANSIKSLGDIALERSDHDTARARYQEALPLYQQLGDLRGQANSILSLGAIALERSDHDTARARHQEALPLYQQLGHLRGQANCILSLGDIAFERSDHDTARARYQEALPLYEQVGDLLGQANSIKSLGDIAFERSDHDTARARYQEALPLYQQLGDLRGQASCMKSLGDIALERSDHDTARARYQEALPLYEQVGSLLGQANCILGLGEIALERSDHDTARARHQEALPLYEQVGSLLGQANCILGLGEIALERSDHDTARARYKEALQLYERIKEPYSIGRTHLRLARIAPKNDEKARHAEAAEEAWRSVGRLDLIDDLHAEFGPG